MCPFFNERMCDFSNPGFIDGETHHSAISIAIAKMETLCREKAREERDEYGSDSSDGDYVGNKTDPVENNRSKVKATANAVAKAVPSWWALVYQEGLNKCGVCPFANIYNHG